MNTTFEVFERRKGSGVDCKENEIKDSNSRKKFNCNVILLSAPVCVRVACVKFTVVQG